MQNDARRAQDAMSPRAPASRLPPPRASLPRRPARWRPHAPPQPSAPCLSRRLRRGARAGRPRTSGFPRPPRPQSLRPHGWNAEQRALRAQAHGRLARRLGGKLLLQALPAPFLGSLHAPSITQPASIRACCQHAAPAPARAPPPPSRAAAAGHPPAPPSPSSKDR